MKITEYNLEENGWNRFDFGVWKTWKKEVSIRDEFFYLDSRYLGDHSNMPDRDWVLHIDNDRHETVGSLSVSTYEQINNFLDILKDYSFGEIITEDTLISKGWKKEIDDVLLSIDSELAVSWTKSVLKARLFYLRISKESNLSGRNWFVHIDNWDFDTVSGLTINTFDQLEKILDLLMYG